MTNSQPALRRPRAGAVAKGRKEASSKHTWHCHCSYGSPALVRASSCAATGKQPFFSWLLVTFWCTA